EDCSARVTLGLKITSTTSESKSPGSSANPPDPVGPGPAVKPSAAHSRSPERKYTSYATGGDPRSSPYCNRRCTTSPQRTASNTFTLVLFAISSIMTESSTSVTNSTSGPTSSTSVRHVTLPVAT